jgi:hypothetical protein
MSDVDIVLSSYCERSMLTKDELDLGVQFYAEALEELRSAGIR